jgi:ABC-type dipeptide/oligopeptide/nickel transport system permease component
VSVPVEDVAAHQAATAVGTVFLTVAVVVLAFGLAAAVGTGVYADQDTVASIGRSIAYAVGAALCSVLLASMLAFFGYVLGLLTEIAQNTHSLQVDVEEHETDNRTE